MKNKCQSFEFDNIDISFQHSVLPENIIGQTKEFDDHSVHKKHGELEKPISNLENENRRIDALDILLVLYDFPKRHQIRELSKCHLKNGTRDKVWLDDYCEKKGVQATTVLRRINNNKAYDQRRNILNTMILSIHFLYVKWSIQYWISN